MFAHKKRHSIGFTKITKTIQSKSMAVMIWAQILATLTTLFTLGMVIVTKDPSSLAILIPSVFFDASAVTALVLWKRKNENVFTFFSDKEMRKAIEWFKEHDIDPVEFFRALKE